MTDTSMIALERVHVAANVRQLDGEHVKALAASISLQGMLVPVVVCPTHDPAAGGFEYELVAGFHRHAAATQLGLSEISAVIRDAEQEASARATENIVRKQLDAHEEAIAVAAMLEKGLSEDGAAQALGWPKARVTARVKLLELPQQARELIGAGTIPLSAVEQLLKIGRTAPRLLELLVGYVAGPEGPRTAGRLGSDPGWVLGQALRQRAAGVFAAYLTTISAREIAQLKLGKKSAEQLAEAERLHRQLDRYAYGPPAIRFSEQDIDQARAAGVLLELDGAQPIIVERSLYRELAKAVIARTVEELRAQSAAAAEERKRAAKRGAAKPADPAAEAKREHNRRLRALAEQAHGANLDLWTSLANGLGAVDPSDINVARAFVYGLLGRTEAAARTRNRASGSAIWPRAGSAW